METGGCWQLVGLEHATYVIYGDDDDARVVVVAACRCCIVVGVCRSLVRFRLPWAC